MKNLTCGEPVKEWRGSGELQLDGRVLPSAFELVQAGSGRMVLTCDVEGWIGLVGGNASLVGRNAAGLEVLVKDCFVRRSAPGGGGEPRTVLTMRPAEYEVRSGTGTPAAFRYGLTNVGLSGARQARFALDGFDLAIRDVKDSSDLSAEAEATRGIAVTAHAVASAAAQDRERLEEVLARVCLLLTLALGRRVEWIYRETLDGEGSLLSVHGRGAVTKPWCGFQLIPDEAVCRFLENAYPHFVAAWDAWGLEKAILSYNDAKLEGDYLEFRALKMAVVMEYLKGRYLVSQSRRRQTFREAVAGLCSSLGVPLGEGELPLLVDVRNSLVHEATFWSDEGAPPQVEQYLFLMTVIGRVFLAIVRQQGVYFDWCGASERNGPREAILELRDGS